VIPAQITSRPRTMKVGACTVQSMIKKNNNNDNNHDHISLVKGRNLSTALVLVYFVQKPLDALCHVF